MPQSAIEELEKQIRQSPEQRLGHKLHAVLFREKGMEYPELAKWFGESPRTLARWVRAYKVHGLAGLQEKQSGRPAQLTPEQRAAVFAVISDGSSSVGRAGTAWTGRTLAEWINQRWGVRLRERQCRRMIEGAKKP
jgi:transposase